MKPEKLFCIIIAFYFLSGILCGCKGNNYDKSTNNITLEKDAVKHNYDNKSDKKFILAKDDIVLVQVNNEPITEYDLEHAINSMLESSTAEKLDEKGKRKVLESLVASKAIAQVQAGKNPLARKVMGGLSLVVADATIAGEWRAPSKDVLQLMESMHKKYRERARQRRQNQGPENREPDKNREKRHPTQL